MRDGTNGWEAGGQGTSRKWFKGGWVVAHCGHPTANYPWAVIDPEGRLHTAGNGCNLGMAFRHVDEARAHVERHLSGELPAFFEVRPERRSDEPRRRRRA